MPLEFQDGIPIYQQLCDYFETLLASGQLGSGEKVRPVREYALELGVNPNTLQKAFGILELKGLLKSERTSGRFVTQDKSTIDALKKEMTYKLIEEYFTKMQAIGFSKHQAVELMVDALKEDRENEKEKE